MKLRKYQKLAMKTRDYPETAVAEENSYYRPTEIIGPALELASEAGEVVGEIKKAFRKDRGLVTLERRTRIVDELGDTLWALAAVADSIGVSLAECAEVNLAKLEARAKEGTIHADDRSEGGPADEPVSSADEFVRGEP